jgi:hypothetical protein
MVALPLAVFIAAAIAWTGFWYYASGAAQSTLDGWRERQAKLGYLYRCASQTLSGYPFRIEVNCKDPDIELRGAQPPLEIRLKDILAVAQVYDPTLIISEFGGPLTAGAPGGQPTWIANWTLAQSSVRGSPSAPERVSLVFDGATVQRRGDAGAAASVKADHIELHGRIVEGSATDHPKIEMVLRLGGVSAPTLAPVAVEPVSGEIAAVLTGMRNLAPRPWSAQLRDIQLAGGHLDITQVRLQQAGSLVVGNGTLTLNAQGQLEGQIQLAIVGLDRLLKDLDLDKAASQLISQADLDKIAPGLDANKLSQGLDRILPGLGGALRNNTGVIAAAGVGALGQRTVLEGRPAVSVPLRFAAGAVFLGPLRLGDVAPLF